MKQTTLFDKGTRPRRKPRKLMHVIDAGHAPGLDLGEHIVRFGCARCDHETEWLVVENVTEAKRGLPCPKCNENHCERCFLETAECDCRQE